MTRRLLGIGMIAAAMTVLLGAGPTIGRASGLSAADKNLLQSSPYVYIASQRKDGSFGRPAEIWFLFHDGAVWVGTPPTSWRAKRIKAGRPNAVVAIGNSDGPSFKAVGTIVKDPRVEELMLKTFAAKYPQSWSNHEQRFRSGFKDGNRILIRYTPEK